MEQDEDIIDLTSFKDSKSTKKQRSGFGSKPQKRNEEEPKFSWELDTFGLDEIDVSLYEQEEDKWKKNPKQKENNNNKKRKKDGETEKKRKDEEKKRKQEEDKKKKQEQKQEEKDRKQREKELEKKKKLEEKELEKKRKQIEKEEQKQLKEFEKQATKKKKSKAECIAEMTVHLDVGLVSSVGGGDILASFQKQCKVEITNLKVKQSIEWIRRTIPIVTESQVVVRLVASQLGNLIFQQQIYPFFKQIRDTHPERSVIYVIEGMEDYLRTQKYLATNDVNSMVISRQDIDKIIVWLQIEAKAQVWETNSTQETSDYLWRITQSIATLPHKEEMSFVGFCAESVVRESKDTWLAQLMQINGVSYQVAKTITTTYPTFQSLMKMYESTGMTEKAKENLLANLERDAVTPVSRKLGPSISKKVYAVFTEVDGSKLVQDL
eukprot:TRINITY_DN14735_c0_g1_i1.p1 TRINITY_DN14735_c0_g1~~TRINITY_DN14735_c0_g1_i1.p1  ORF type:complete len:436 (+),score=134.93 TRINITY_DN14735_c0_g1_i1:1196-2503(+)